MRQEKSTSISKSRKVLNALWRSSPPHQFRFEQPHLILSFDKSYLMNKLVHADPIASQIAINQCETELICLG